MTYGSAGSMRDLVAVIQQDFSAAEVEHVKRDQLIPYRGTLSTSKALRLLGYAPQHPIDVGFPKYIQWYEQLTRASA